MCLRLLSRWRWIRQGCEPRKSFLRGDIKSKDFRRELKDYAPQDLATLKSQINGRSNVVYVSANFHEYVSRKGDLIRMLRRFVP